MTERVERPFTMEDERFLAGRGIRLAEAERQLGLLRSPPPSVRLARPCTPGDGIVRLTAAESDRLLEVHERAAAAGRVSLFVPASGAASRMFKDLLAMAAREGPLEKQAVLASAAAGDPQARALAGFVEGLPRLALSDELAAGLAARGDDLARLSERGPWRPILAALLGPDGLDLAERPKGLLPFHRGPHGPRTPLEEHLEESAGLVRDSAGTCRIQFTVSPEHLGDFESRLAETGPREGARLGARFDVRFTVQDPATGTLSLDAAGMPVRDEAGALVLRPSGHGALLRNLGQGGGDLVFLRNVDNVSPAATRAPSSRWSRVLCALAAELSARAQSLLARLADASDTDAASQARRFLREEFGEADPPQARAELGARLARPVRACGMVRNTGEPGGGPFWVSGADGRVSPQIVEAAQVGPGDPEQQAIFAGATHFNPVFLAVALCDSRGRPYELESFVDERAVLISRKSSGGRELLALERPGLWNGAMAGWLTVFVEVPMDVFNPVKTVLDLLRPAHQA